MTVSIEKRLNELKLRGMSEALSIRNLEAINGKLSYYEFLELLVQDELNTRRDRRINNYIKNAKFRELKSFENFDWDFNKSINRKQIFDLATCRFIEQGDNIIFLGKSGTGKSFMAQAIGLCAAKRNNSVVYRSAFDFATEISEAEILGKRKEKIKYFVKPRLLIIDDFGLKTLPSTAGEDFLEIIMRRYEVNSTILTSNRPIEDFGQILHDNTSSMAILDRFLHHSHVIKITGKSYRLAHRTNVYTEEEIEIENKNS